MVRSVPMHERLAEAVARFEQIHMGLCPKSVEVDIHRSHILVTLAGVVSAAERQSARDLEVRELLEKLAAAAFDAVSGDIDAEVEQITGRTVVGSRISIDPLAGDAILKFLLEDTEPQAKSLAEG